MKLLLIPLLALTLIGAGCDSPCYRFTKQYVYLKSELNPNYNKELKKFNDFIKSNPKLWPLSFSYSLGVNKVIVLSVEDSYKNCFKDKECIIDYGNGHKTPQKILKTEVTSEQIINDKNYTLIREEQVCSH